MIKISIQVSEKGDLIWKEHKVETLTDAIQFLLDNKAEGWMIGEKLKGKKYKSISARVCVAQFSL